MRCSARAVHGHLTSGRNQVTNGRNGRTSGPHGDRGAARVSRAAPSVGGMGAISGPPSKLESGTGFPGRSERWGGRGGPRGVGGGGLVAAHFGAPHIQSARSDGSRGRSETVSIISRD